MDIGNHRRIKTPQECLYCGVFWAHCSSSLKCVSGGLPDGLIGFADQLSWVLRSWFVFTAIATYAKWTPNSSSKLISLGSYNLISTFATFPQHVKTAPHAPLALLLVLFSLNCFPISGLHK